MFQSILPIRPYPTGYCKRFLGGIFLLLVLLLSEHANGQTSPLTAPEKDRNYLDDPFGPESRWLLNRAVDATNKKLSHQLEDQDWERGLVDACDLYVAIVTHPNRSLSKSLEGKQRKLLSILRRSEKQLKRKTKLTARVPKTQLPAEAPSAAMNTNSPLAKPTASKLEADEALKQADFDYLGPFTDGPHQMWSRSGGAFVGEADDLIRLIQTTVTPGVWDVNGGSATIMYYERVHALVVRAPWSTHDQTQGLVDGLRR